VTKEKHDPRVRSLPEGGKLGLVIWTVGHSNQPVALLLATLSAAGIELLVDVRRYPASRRNPQFNRDALVATLRAEGIEYLHAADLGGRREPMPDSANAGLRDAGFRGYADYMQSEAFGHALEALLQSAQSRRTAIMCAEAVPWRCHRSLIADALVARGVEVEHLLGDRARRHVLTAAARVDGHRVTYPALL
jgi:uncharacterized protein (DUF488 family)